MKQDQTIRLDYARRDNVPGGDFASLDPVASGRVHVLEVPPDAFEEVEVTGTAQSFTRF